MRVLQRLLLSFAIVASAASPALATGPDQACIRAAQEQRERCAAECTRGNQDEAAQRRCNNSCSRTAHEAMQAGCGRPPQAS